MRGWLTAGAMVLTAGALTGCPVEPGSGGPVACTSIEEVPIAGFDGRFAQVSASGDDLVYVLDGEVRHLDLVTGSDVEVSGDVPDDQWLWGLQITPDGSRAAVIATTDANTSEAFVIDLATRDAAPLDWTGVAPYGWGYDRSFSSDLSVYVHQVANEPQLTVIPSDGSALRFLPLVDGRHRVDLTGSTVAGGTKAVRNGVLRTFPGAVGPFGGVTGLNRAGDRVQVATAAGAVLWSPDTGAVAPLTLPGIGAATGGYGTLTDDGGVFVGYETVGGTEKMVRVDRTTGATADVPPSLDGITSIDDAGTIFTSTTNAYYRCVA